VLGRLRAKGKGSGRQGAGNRRRKCAGLEEELQSPRSENGASRSSSRSARAFERISRSTRPGQPWCARISKKLSELFLADVDAMRRKKAAKIGEGDRETPPRTRRVRNEPKRSASKTLSRSINRIVLLLWTTSDRCPAPARGGCLASGGISLLAFETVCRGHRRGPGGRVCNCLPRAISRAHDRGP